MNTPPEKAPRELPLAVPLHENQRIAEILERIAELLEAQNASAFRARAYRHAAIELRLRRVGIGEVFAVRGVQGLIDLPGIGLSIANVIAEYLQSGHVELLRRLEGHASPEDLFATLPGIGAELARRLHRELGVETLEDLESAAHDGRLEQVAGFGPRRVSALRDLLAARLARSPRSRRIRNGSADAVTGAAPALDVATLLGLDAQYRELAASGALHTIAPRRFNPRREAWLPIWHTERDGWHITALFSNTALAHQLGATRDWVILYYERDGNRWAMHGSDGAPRPSLRTPRRARSRSGMPAWARAHAGSTDGGFGYFVGSCTMDSAWGWVGHYGRYGPPGLEVPAAPRTRAWHMYCCARTGALPRKEEQGP